VDVAEQRPLASGDVAAEQRRPLSSGDVAENPRPLANAADSMPSVVHYNAAEMRPHRQLPAAERPVSAVYFMSDGVRRRLVPEDQPASPPPPPPDPDLRPAVEVAEMVAPPRRYRLEPAAGAGAGSSVGNVGEGGGGAEAWPREEVAVLSQQRRDEIRQQQERARQQTLVLRFGGVQVCQATSSLNYSAVAR